MSHFTVLVIGENPEDQLAPFHEFECTGEDNEYVQDIDITEQLRKEYEESTETRYKAPDGSLHKPYQDQFYREFTEEELKKHRPLGTGFGGGLSYTSKDWNDGKGYRAKVHFLPDGWEEIELPKKDCMSFVQYCIDYEGKPKLTQTGLGFEKRENKGKVSAPYKYGYTVTDDMSQQVLKVIDRTNPNKKWDWYKLGGRWTGFFKLKPVKQIGYNQVFDSFEGFTAAELEQMAEIKKKSPRKFRQIMGKYGDKGAAISTKIDEIMEDANGSIYPPHEIGDPGLMTDPARKGYADAALKKYIDFESMRNEAAQEAAERYDKVMSFIADLPVHTSWDKIRDENKDDIDKARKIYWNQERCAAFNQKRELFEISHEPDAFLVDRETYIQNARNRAISTFAVIKDGKWYEKGSMGFWACVSNEKDQDEWEKEFSSLLDTLPDDTLISVYDCHI